MGGLRVVPALALVALFGSGCVRDAEIATPADPSGATEKIELTGMGGWGSGQFQLGASQGRFTRRAAEIRTDGVYVENLGGGSFEAAGAEVGGRLAGSCDFHRAELDAGLLTVSRHRLAYGCEFARDGRRIPGGLLLAEVPRGRGLLAGRTRAGELQLGDLVVGIRAIHDLKGGALPSGTPLGYAFDVGGRQIGAVDLNGTDKTIYTPRAPGAEREAVLAASLALSVFWDPGE